MSDQVIEVNLNDEITMEFHYKLGIQIAIAILKDGSPLEAQKVLENVLQIDAEALAMMKKETN